MAFIDGFPKTVTLEQMQAACAALGLPTRHVVAVSMDVRSGVTAVLHVANDAGQKLAHDGDALLTEIRIPRAHEKGVDDAAP